MTKTKFDAYPILTEAFREYQKQRYKESLSLLKKHLPKLERLGKWDAQLAYAYGLIGNNLFLLGKVDDCMPFFRKASVINKHLKVDKALHDLWWLGHCFERKKNWKRAAQVYKEIATIAPRVGQQESGWVCQSQAMEAVCRYQIKEFDQSLALFESSVNHAYAEYVTLNTVSAVAERVFHYWRITSTKRLKSRLLRLSKAMTALVAKRLHTLSPPKTPAYDSSENFFGTIVEDPYRWLENIQSRPVKTWIDNQNHVSELYLNSIPSRTEFLEALHQLGPLSSLRIHWRRGKYFFSSDRPLTQLFRSSNINSAPKVVLDSTKFPDDVVIQNVSVSSDGKFVAYWLATGGSDWHTIRVRDISTGKDVRGIIKDARATSLAWKRDCSGFYYTAHSRSNDYTEIRFHKLGTVQSKDKLIYRVSKLETYAGAHLVNSEKHLLVDLTSTRRNLYSNFLIDLADGSTIPIAAEQESHYVFIGQNDEKLFFRTNKDAPLERIVSVNLSSLENAKAKKYKPRFHEEIAQRNLSLKFSFAWGAFLVCVYGTTGGDIIRRYSKGRQLKAIRMPLGIAILDFGFLRYPDVEVLAEGYVCPQTLYKLNLESGLFEEIEQEQRSFDTKDYVVEERQAKSKDGAKVPYYIRYKKGLKRDGSNPTIISGYGGFGHALSPSFNSYDLLWSSFGGIVVDTVLRGDNGLGTTFRNQGTRETKQKTFDDLIAVAEDLIRKKYTSRTKLGITGGSNGGLLVGAVLTQRPELIAAAHCNAALLDMLRFHNFGTEKHYAAEYCSATNKRHYKILRAYSPLHNLFERNYPPVLIDTGSHDDRVNPAHSYKFAATLQKVQTAKNPVLLKVEKNVGHGFVRTSMRDFDRLCFFGYHLGLLPASFYESANGR
ncbi:MAG TPA: prolyl oligopeptidase family serine peptidase [Drouetiella sp.]